MKRILAAQRALAKKKLSKAFDPARPNSRPNPKQQSIFDDLGKIQYRYVTSGNQCKPGFSLVSMADGSKKPISDICVEDKILCYDTKSESITTTTVVNTFFNQNKEVFKFSYSTGGGLVEGYFTENHEVFEPFDGEKQEVVKAKNVITIQDGSPVVSRRISYEYYGILNTYDITVDHPDHNYICENVVTGNSGKSSTASREIAWILNDDHPTWERPEEWKNESLLIIIACQDLAMGETELWHKKLKPFLDMGQWSEKRNGGTLKRVVHKTTGDQIVFLSHSDGSEKNRKHMQGYTAHYVWLDEMPSSWEILEELQLRVQAKKGYFLATFTPKFRNDRIRKAIDNGVEPFSKKYSMSKFDNPIFADQFEAEMARLKGQPQSVINTILYGAWATGENAVYNFDYDTMVVKDLPPTYTPAWRHVEAVDPALSSKSGYTLWAEDPLTGTWYLINDKYIEGSEFLDPETHFKMVQSRSQGYNIIKRISDTMPFFLNTAAKYKVYYQTPFNKNDGRKSDLIKGLQSALVEGKIKIAAWCDTFIDEIQSCQYREDSDVIVKASRFHTLDCAQYFCDAIPKHDLRYAPVGWEVKLRLEHQDRIQQEETNRQLTEKYGKSKVGPKPIGQWTIPRRRSGRRRGF